MSSRGLLPRGWFLGIRSTYIQEGQLSAWPCSAPRAGRQGSPWLQVFLVCVADSSLGSLQVSGVAHPLRQVVFFLSVVSLR